MIGVKLLLCMIIVAAWHKHEAESANLPLLPVQAHIYAEWPESETLPPPAPAQVAADWAQAAVVRRPGAWRSLVREGAPPPLCARRCSSPRVGPVCAFDAAGRARTFSTLCELEAVSCRESKYYAVSSLGEC